MNALLSGVAAVLLAVAFVVVAVPVLVGCVLAAVFFACESLMDWMFRRRHR